MEDDVSPVVIKKKETPPISKFQRMSDSIKDFPSHEEAKIFVKLNRMKYGYFLYLIDHLIVHLTPWKGFSFCSFSYLLF